LHESRHGCDQGLFVCGVIAGPLFVLVFLVEGAMTPEYDPLRHPVSSLALGSFGWIEKRGVLPAQFDAQFRS
jgi:Protein of unknown function (DUF998)